MSSDQWQLMDDTSKGPYGSLTEGPYFDEDIWSDRYSKSLPKNVRE